MVINEPVPFSLCMYCIIAIFYYCIIIIVVVIIIANVMIIFKISFIFFGKGHINMSKRIG